MADYPYIPWYPRDWLADTRKLTLEQRGAYLDLINFCWLTPDCHLEDDDDELARLVGVTKRRWISRIRPAIERYWTIERGRWTQKRLAAEHQKCVEKVKKNRHAAAQGGKAKALNRQRNGLANASRTLEPKASYNRSRIKKEESTCVTSESPTHRRGEFVPLGERALACLEPHARSPDRHVSPESTGPPAKPNGQHGPASHETMTKAEAEADLVRRREEFLRKLEESSK